MGQLMGEQLDADEEFWNQDAWQAEDDEEFVAEEGERLHLLEDSSTGYREQVGLRQPWC